MTGAVAIVDYGIGNLLSVQRAFEHNGAEVAFVHDADGIARAPRLVLPGVGAFADGMKGLAERGLDEAVAAFARSGRPMLGICLGMQMLASESEEFGTHKGLGLVPGRVVPVPAADSRGKPHKIPHIGWSGLGPSAGASWQGSILAGTPEGTAAYLVHSFHLVPDDPAHLLADCFYGGHRITAAVRAGNIFGCQFHPEKSGPAGLRILAAFLEI
jgi:glutamine amidotransferase